jgi:hypothetical protein
MVRKGGHRAEKGTYWNMVNGEKVVLEEEGILPGTGTYIKAPTWAVLLAGPILGLVYAVFLPFIGIAMTAGVIAKKAGSAAAKGASFGWRPIEAYLTGRKKAGGAKREKKDKNS